MHMIIKTISTLLEASGWLAKACALALVALVTANVFARYFFSTGNVGLQELEWHLISPIALLGMSYALQHGDHVRVDVFYERMSQRSQTLVDLLTAVLTFLVGSYLAALAIPYVEASYAMGQGSPDPGGLPHRFLLKSFIPLGFGLLALQAVATFIQACLTLRRLRRAPAGSHSDPETDPLPQEHQQ